MARVTAQRKLRNKPARRANRRSTLTNSFKPPRRARTVQLKRKNPFVSSLRAVAYTTVALFFIAFIGYQFFLPHYLFQLSKPQNILVVPANLESSDDILIFAHLDSVERRRSFRVIDGTAETEVLGGYGKYQLQNVYPLLALENKDSQFIAANFNYALKLVIDQVLVVDTLTAEMVSQGSLEKLFLEKAVLRMSPDFLRLHYLARQQTSERIAVLGATDFGKLVSEYKTIHDQTARNCPVAVINTTKTRGLAGVISKIVEDNGGLVVRITNEQVQFSNSTLYVGERAEAECQEVIALVSSLFPEGLNRVPANPDMTARYRSQLILFAGDDISETFDIAGE